jgi:ABC-type multidrug transport system ATPase subunit
MELSIESVKLRYGQKHLLNSVSMQLHSGQITGLIGRNGSGKSSLLKLIFGHIEGQRKLLKLDRRPIKPPLYASGKAFLLPQSHLFPKEFTVESALGLYRKTFADFMDTFPETAIKPGQRLQILSGGERKLIELFCAVNSKKEILLLDEPFNGLSPLNSELLINELHRIKPKTVILITDHRIHEVMALSDQLYLLDKGKSSLIVDQDDLRVAGYPV